MSFYFNPASAAAPVQAYALLAVSILLGSVGQIFLKFASTRVDTPHVLNPLFNWYLVMAIMIYGASVLIYALSLRHIPLSIAYPSVGMSYVIVAVTSHRIWGSPFGIRELVALVLIVGGVGLLATGTGDATGGKQ
jgi:small multidrug resistance pump